MKEHTCPKCGTPVINSAVHGVTFVALTGVVTHHGRTCRLRPMQIDILEQLLDAFPAGVPTLQLLTGISPHCDETSRGSLTATISQMRRTFESAGMLLAVHARKGWGDRSEYALLLKEPEQEQQAQVA